ncbi:hypothetical protein [Pandoraea commovens]|uniref:Tetratricopeptide repeat protein n=1 Tax=Pandoraea commovens TaxID=2508289 RepID=A0A5E4XUU4_9BURK|nr:hypothetical protein [Pandoraea commovens]VVE40221.1 hypothetical protein PCO31010_04124 [Pandoraea commovens]
MEHASRPTSLANFFSFIHKIFTMTPPNIPSWAPPSMLFNSLHLGESRADTLQAHAKNLQTSLGDAKTDSTLAFDKFWQQATRETAWSSIKRFFHIDSGEKRQTLKALARSHVASLDGGSEYLKQRGEDEGKILASSQYLLEKMTPEAHKSLNSAAVGEDGVVFCKLADTDLRILLLTPNTQPSEICLSVMTTQSNGGLTLLNEISTEHAGEPSERSVATYGKLANLFRHSGNLDAAARYSEKAGDYYLAKAAARWPSDTFEESVSVEPANSHKVDQRCEEDNEVSDRHYDDLKDEGCEAKHDDVSPQTPQPDSEELKRAADAYRAASVDHQALAKMGGDKAEWHSEQAWRLGRLSSACSRQASGEFSQAANLYEILASAERERKPIDRDRYFDMVGKAVRLHCDAGAYEKAADLCKQAHGDALAMGSKEIALKFAKNAASAHEKMGARLLSGEWFTSAAQLYQELGQELDAANHHIMAAKKFDECGNELARAAGAWGAAGNALVKAQLCRGASQMCTKAAQRCVSNRDHESAAKYFELASTYDTDLFAMTDNLRQAADQYRLIDMETKADELNGKCKIVWKEHAENIMKDISDTLGKLRSDVPSRADCERFAKQTNQASLAYSQALAFGNEDERQANLSLLENCHACEAAWNAMAKSDYETAVVEFRKVANDYENRGEHENAGQAFLMTALAYKGAKRSADAGYEYQLAAGAFFRAKLHGFAGGASTMAAREFRDARGKELDTARAYMFAADQYLQCAESPNGAAGNVNETSGKYRDAATASALAGEIYVKAGKYRDAHGAFQLSAIAYEGLGDAGATKTNEMLKKAERCSARIGGEQSLRNRSATMPSEVAVPA